MNPRLRKKLRRTGDDMLFTRPEERLEETIPLSKSENKKTILSEKVEMKINMQM